ncbi:hypothetical protein [Segatella oris]|uniref:hypothetical protein n=1 Tax=Segatella oris TaxID=28135 RepID=UPI0028E59102|nr:hypothetical protein [Segatella oris]
MIRFNLFPACHDFQSSPYSKENFTDNPILCRDIEITQHAHTTYYAKREQGEASLPLPAM